jgi:pyridoxal 5'-phosphate synthase pdxT subunit
VSAVGVVSLQGDYQKHATVIAGFGLPVVEVRTPDDLSGVSGLVIPGGESTTIGMLMERSGLLELVRQRAKDGLPIFATCAGLILLARDIENSGQVRIGVLDICVRRNAYGRQIESFEARIPVPALGGEEIEAVFIRAPVITRTGPDIEVLGRFEDSPVLVRAGRILAASFHPELTGDTRLHRYFLHRVIGCVPG